MMVQYSSSIGGAGGSRGALSTRHKAPLEPPAPLVEPELRRSIIERGPSTRYPPHECVMHIDEGEPECFEEAMSHWHKSEWVKAMQEEIKSLNKNHTNHLVKLPKGKRVSKNKWVYRLQTENNSQHKLAESVFTRKAVDYYLLLTLA